MSEPKDFVAHVEEEYPDYLKDESRRTGQADSISFPRSEADVAAALRDAAGLGRTVTVQGARTGITGGAVPEGGHVLNLGRMNRMLGLAYEPARNEFRLRVQPGVLLSEVNDALSGKGFDAAGWSEESRQALSLLESSGRFLFTPDPTETGASVGGMVSCNASGARSFRYGSTRDHVTALRVVLADGEAVVLRRGEQKARGRSFALATVSGREIRGHVPSYTMPAVKNAAGYFARDDMDLVDLFVGAEGTLGVVTEIELRLVRAPAALWGVTAFLATEEQAVHFVRTIRENRPRPAAIEFFSSRALDLLREQKRTNPAFESIPDLQEAWHTAVYVEYHGDSEGEVEEAVAGMSERLLGCGGDEEATWLAGDEREVARLREFRHAVPEAVNLLIDERRKAEPRITKLGTDLAVPDAQLEAVMSLYHAGLDREQLEFVIFGHIGSNHVHVNILPNSLEEYERGRALYGEWAKAVLAMGGTVSAEHGIGKLKTGLLGEMYGDEGIREMRGLKSVFDPGWILNPGNLFGEDRGSPKSRPPGSGL